MARVLLVVTAGIAAYKTPDLVRRLRDAGHDVRVARTPGAAAFVADLALGVVSGHPVASELFDAAAEVAGLDPAQAGPVGHVALADWPDVVLVAPATADFLAKAATGLADDLPSTLLLATRAPVVFAPAMNVNMWHHPATAANVATLAARGARIVEPEAGALACGWEGKGRMASFDALLGAVAAALGAGGGPLAGRSVLVTAGPTRTPIDAVRFLTNGSTGTMGFAVAAEAARRGADVVLVAGPTHLPTPAGVRRVDVVTAFEMREAVFDVLERKRPALAVMTAAVQDLWFDGVREGKVPKEALADSFGRLKVRCAPDILAEAVRAFGSRTYFVGFAAETLDESGCAEDPLVVKARAKKARKGCPALFANRVDTEGTGFGPGTNAGVLLLDDRVEVLDHPRPKPEVAAWLLDHVEAALDAAEAAGD